MGQGLRQDDPGAGLISAKMAKALANAWRARILAELSVRPMSPSQFVDEVGGELTNISRCFRQLAEWDYIEIVETRKGGRRRGGVEHVYRGIRRAQYDSESWQALPRLLRDDISGNILASYLARITEAVEAGTFDAEISRHLSWDGVALDRQAWDELGSKLDEILDWLPELEAESTRRMAESEEEPIPTTVGLTSFRSPKPSEIAK